jgi:hypothetical protein
VLCKPGSQGAASVRPAEKDSPESPKLVPSPAAETTDTQYSAIKDEALKELLVRLEKRIAEREGC